MVDILIRIKHFLFTYDWEVVEIQGAAFKITWGFWLLLPFDTFRAVSGYNSVGTENIWGACLFIFGIMHLLAVMRGSRSVRRVFTFIGFLFWLFTILLVWQQAPTAALIPFFMVIAFFMGINFIRIGIPISLERRRHDDGPPDGQEERRENNVV